MVRIARALISVSDKSGIVAFAAGLRDAGVSIISTGGTARLLQQGGIDVEEVAAYTGFPEMLDGRVKTLHPKVHAGLLALRSKEEHLKTLSQQGIPMIDMLVVNLYPFEEVSRRRDATLVEAIENIDIGGPALIRSAAKNHQSVAVVTSRDQYQEVLAALKEHRGHLPARLLERLALEAFRRTSSYDGQIADYLDARYGSSLSPAQRFPGRMSVSFEKIQDLRYGENPHQRAALYADAGSAGGLALMRQLQGKELSFNNILDAQAARELVAEFARPASAIIKHSNPCGAAEAGSLSEAFRQAWASDPLSAFGGIVALNRSLDARTARAVAASGFLECVIAPGFSPGALERFAGKKNLRIIQVPAAVRRQPVRAFDFKQVSGGMLVQDQDNVLFGAGRPPKVVTRKKPTARQMRTLRFAWAVAKHVKSNAIVLACETASIGIGAGQTSRVDAVCAALRKAGRRAKGSCLASDAFFPKPDSIEEAARAGVSAIIQPGGSIADDEIILACNRSNISMVFTRIRHFKH